MGFRCFLAGWRSVGDRGGLLSGVNRSKSLNAMNKGKDFWAPRRHGFDDDGPMAYEPRQRPSRPYGRPDSPFDESNSAGAASASASQTAVEAIVKWFKDEKGFGFVE